jgi:hypothetical protein
MKQMEKALCFRTDAPNLSPIFILDDESVMKQIAPRIAMVTELIQNSCAKRSFLKKFVRFPEKKRQ